MSFVVASRRLSPHTLATRYGRDALCLDLTSRGPEPWVRFSPFFPHGDVPVPFSPGRTGASVEGIWQGLKVFDSADVDPSKLTVTSMKGLKRTVRRFGPVRGHRKGLEGTELLSYRDARYAIYLPAYRWVLDHRLQPELAQLRQLAAEHPTVVLLDYETNCDVEDLSKPLSHAGLVKRALDGDWPDPRGLRTVRGDATRPLGEGPRVPPTPSVPGARPPEGSRRSA